MKCCDLHAGMLRHSVDIQQRGAEVADGQGGVVEALWPNVEAGVRGHLKPTTGRERYHADRLEGTVTHVFYCRYRSGWTTAMRLVYDSRPMQILAVLNIEERNQWLQLLLEEGVPT